MGQAKLRRESGAKVTPCRNCTLCCELPKIAELDKPLYHACRFKGATGCTIHGDPSRPEVCRAFECRYVQVNRPDAAPQHVRVPHPSDAGAYFFEVAGTKDFLLHVDPKRPEVWKRSSIPAYLRPYFEKGFVVTVVDRGYRFAFSVASAWDQYLGVDMVEIARQNGRGIVDESYATA